MGSKRKRINGSTCDNLSSVELIKGGGDIPEWMLFEVLMRLPVEVLFKFKIVSKQWYSMISEPSFARMYVARTSRFPHSQPWTRIGRFSDMATIKHFFGQKLPLSGCPLGIDFLQRFKWRGAKHPDHSDHIIAGISNGLVLYDSHPKALCYGGIYGYNICNPVTGQILSTVPPCERCYKAIIGTGFVTQIEDNVLASYRVVCIYNFDKRGVFRFEVYFSEIGEWMNFNIDFEVEIRFDRSKKHVALGKILHWMVSGHRIMAYDPYNKPNSFRLISLPIVGDLGYDKRAIMLDNHQGYLRYFEVKSDATGRSRALRIWALNDYDSGAWFLQHRVGVDNIQCDGGQSLSLLPLFFHPFDSDIVYVDYGESLYSYDVKTRKLEAVDHSPNIYQPLFYLWSYLFVLPPWPVSVRPSSFESP